MPRLWYMLLCCLVWACAQQAARPSSDTVSTPTESVETTPKRRWVHTRADPDQMAAATGTAIGTVVGTVVGEAIKGCTLVR